jgi:predicted nucleic acid-binding Zn ribbon protein
MINQREMPDVLTNDFEDQCLVDQIFKQQRRRRRRLKRLLVIVCIIALAVGVVIGWNVKF